MESQDFSFTKRPIDRNSIGAKRSSAISTNLPNSSVFDETSTEDTRNRLFSIDSEKNLIDPEIKGDNPMLDYNEQIRAPKVRSHKSVGDIDFSGTNNSAFKDFTLSLKPAEDYQGKKQYLPATADISYCKNINNPISTTSTSVGDEIYNIQNYLKSAISSNQLITNLDPLASLNRQTSAADTATTSPLSSKKSSYDSILTSRKQSRFTMVPIRPLDEPKTPNYVPCVLRLSHEASFNDLLNSNMIPKSSSKTFANPSDLSTSPVLNDSSISRRHWKPDGSTTQCTDCSAPFTLLNRRHHCRKCGGIFCADCLISKAKLNPTNCGFEMNGSVLAKVCFDCGKEWSRFIVGYFKQFDDLGDLNFPKFKRGSNSKVNSIFTDRVGKGVKDKESTTDQKKVPADWAWSSF